MTFGEKLQMLRKARGWTQEQLAENVGVSRQSMSKWESNAALPDTANVIVLADLFGVTTDYLLRDMAHAEESAPQGMPEAAAEPAVQELPRTIQLVPARKKAPAAVLILGGILLLLGAAVWLYFQMEQSNHPCIYMLGGQRFDGIQGYIRTKHLEAPYYGSIIVMVIGAVMLLFYAIMKLWLYIERRIDDTPSEC